MTKWLIDDFAPRDFSEKLVGIYFEQNQFDYVFLLGHESEGMCVCVHVRVCVLMSVCTFY